MFFLGWRYWQKDLSRWPWCGYWASFGAWTNVGSAFAGGGGSGLILTAAASLPWFWLAFRQNGFVFISMFFINQNIARYRNSIHHHSQPFYYYLPVLLPFHSLERLVIPPLSEVPRRGIASLAAVESRHSLFGHAGFFSRNLFLVVGFQARGLHFAGAPSACAAFGRALVGMDWKRERAIAAALSYVGVPDALGCDGRGCAVFAGKIMVATGKPGSCCP